jgi:hypothetical protein
MGAPKRLTSFQGAGDSIRASLRRGFDHEGRCRLCAFQRADDVAAGDFLKVSLAIKDGIAQERFQTLRFSKRPAS